MISCLGPNGGSHPEAAGPGRRGQRPIRELLRLHLELGGFAVDEVGDGTRALEQARATAFDLLILDVMLPGSAAGGMTAALTVAV